LTAQSKVVGGGNAQNCALTAHERGEGGQRRGKRTQDGESAVGVALGRRVGEAQLDVARHELLLRHGLDGVELLVEQLVFDVLERNVHAADDVVLQVLVLIPDGEEDLLHVTVRHIAGGA
jgi:hypothetical protein